LAVEYPGSVRDLCALDFDNPFQLLVATVLSAQTTDERVNMVTPKVFARYPRPADLGEADPDELEGLIHSTGFFRSKARSLIGLGRALDERFGGQVPPAMEDLVSLPGVGRKTANVVRSVGFELPGLAVDTHVTRLTRLLGLTDATDPVRIETDVTALLPGKDWGTFGLRLILHGRRVCVARRPRCGECVLSDFCPSSLVPVRRSPPRRAQPPAGTDPVGTDPVGTDPVGTDPVGTGPTGTGPTALAGARAAGVPGGRRVTG
jgi:endonuclease-3